MTWGALFTIFIIIILIFFAMGQRIAFALGFASVIGLVLTNDFVAFRLMGMAIWKNLNTFELIAIPLFLFMGEIVVACNLSGRFYRGAIKVVGRIPGGFFQTNIISCAVFACISGSSVATAASIGSVAYPELDKRGYDKRLNLGTLGAGGALGLLIPPSITMLVYGAITGTSIAKLFMAGLIPGLLAVLVFMLYIFIRVKINPSLVPELPPKASFQEKMQGLVDMLPFLFLVALILCSIYQGWATPTEAAALSAFAAILIAILYREFSLKRLIPAAIRACKSTCMIMFIVIGAAVFGQLIVRAGISRDMMIWFSALNMQPLTFFFIITIIYLCLGCFMDGTSLVYFTVPLLFPMTQFMGFDPIWLGVIIVILVEVAMITPPVGLNLFVLLGVTGKTAAFEDVCIGNAPFVGLYLMFVGILYIFPMLATWLPSTMF